MYMNIDAMTRLQLSSAPKSTAYVLFFSIAAMLGTAAWNINLISVRETVGTTMTVLTWFRLVAIMAGLLSFVSFLIIPSSGSVSSSSSSYSFLPVNIPWKTVVGSSVLLIAYQCLLLYTFSIASSAWPLVIINLNMAVVYLYQVMVLHKSISWTMDVLLGLYIAIGSLIVYYK